VRRKKHQKHQKRAAGFHGMNKPAILPFAPPINFPVMLQDGRGSAGDWPGAGILPHGPMI
jgi:hypothetical protein